MKASKKTIAIVIATLVLVVSAVTGVVMYLNDDGTARAGFDENEPVISQGNNNAGTEENNNQGEENPAVPGEEEPGTLPEAGENGEQGTTTGTTPTTPAGTTGTTTDTTVPNEEYVTERIEEVERQITEDLLVGWTPIRINSAYSTLNLGIVKPELSILKISATEDDNNSISAGDILTYVLAVKNDGKEDITGVNVSDIIPAQTTLIEKSIYGEGTYNKELNKIKWKVDVKAGEIVAVGFAVIVNQGAAGNIENVGTINGEETEKTVNPVIESSKISEIFRDEQKVEEPANIGDKLTYTVTVKNTGTIPAQAFVQDTVPVNTELVSDIVLAGETIDEATMVAGKNITVAPGETETLTFTVEIKAIDGAIENIAKVGGTTPTDVVKTANLEMSKTVSATGEEGTYTENITLGADETAYFRIELKNTGSEALELELTDVMGETTLELFDGQEKVTGTITVAANETKVLTATYTMQQSDIDNQEVLTNTIVATDKDNKIPGGEDTATVTPEDPAPSLYVEKTTSTVTPVDSADFAIEQPITDKTRVRPGDVITYTIYVKNDGNITLYNVDVTDSLDVKYNGTLIKASKGDVIEQIATFAPGAEKTYHVKYTVTQADIDAGEPITNVAIATDGTITAEDKTDKDIPVNPDVTVSGSKTWVDYNNQEGTRPEKITVKLMNGTEEVASATVSGPDWSYEFTNLAKYDAENNVINYTVVEEGAEGYTPDYTDRTVATNGDITANITNTLNYTPTVSLSGTKSWVDYDNQEETRPENIEIEVISSDSTDTTERKATIGKKADETYDWTYTFTGLPKYDAKNNVISYSVEETGVDTNKYRATYGEVKVDETNGDITANITNTLNYTPTVTLTGTKTWNDNSNQDGLRPENITIAVISSDTTDRTERLTTIGKKVDGTYDWTYTFTGLPKYDADNNVISYSVEETGVDTNKYRVTYGEVEVDETNGDITANITNTYIKPELTKVKSSTAGEKVNLGEEITYKIKTTNSGKTNVKSVIVTDAVPAYTTLVTGSISAGGTLGSDGKTITWNIGDLAVGASKEVSFKVTVNTTADTIGKTISNTGYVNGEKTNTVDTVVDKKVTVSTVEYPVKAIDVVLVLDTSTSMEDYSRIDNAKSAACKFIDGIFPSGTSNTGSTVTVITFNNTATKLGKATDTKSATTLKNQINAIKLKTGDDSVGTHIYNALTLTNTELQKLSNTNKFVVFLSDGAPSSPFSIWKNQKGNETYYENELFTTNTEANITAAANAVKANSTGVYSIGFGIDKLSTEREYWSNYSVCTSGRSCKKEHIKVDGTKYHWESCNSYAKRVLKDIIADKFVPATETTPEKKYYYEATDSATSIVNQFMTVLQEISTKKRTVTATSSTVKITVTETINTNKDIKIIIDGVKHPCKLSDLPQYGVSYNATENYFTWDITNYATSTLKLEYTIK